MHTVLDWARGIPQHRVVTPGKVHDLKGAMPLHWVRHWTYIFDRAYLGFEFLRTLLEAGAHFVVRFKEGVGYRILERFAVPQAPATAGFRLRARLDHQFAGLGRHPLAAGQLPVARWKVDSSLDRSL